MTVRTRFAAALDRFAPVVAVIGGLLVVASILFNLYLSVEVHTLQQQTAQRGQQNQVLLKRLAVDEHIVTIEGGYIVQWQDWAARIIAPLCAASVTHHCSPPPAPPGG